MRTLFKVLSVLLVVAIVVAALPSVALADKGGNGKGNSSPASNGAGQDKEKSSNGSGDKKALNANNGKNTAQPDEDGKGADHGVVTGSQDKEYDGNNGCGNDKDDPNTPFEDDNNGKCLGHRKDKGGEEEGGSEGGSSGGGEEETTEEGGSEDGEEERTRRDDSIRICFYSRGNAVEVSDVDTEDILGFVVLPDAFEETVITEDWHRVCWDAKSGEVYYVLAWNATDGHAGPVYMVEVTEDATGTVEIFNPFNGTIIANGVIATRINPDSDEIRPFNPL